MDKKVLITLIVNFIIAVSSYQLLQLINLPHNQLDQTSKLRFLCFLGIHAMLFVSMIAIIKLQGSYTYIILTFINCLIVVVAITITEIMVRQIQQNPFYNYRKQSGNNENFELTYLNLYFLAYMYSIIGLVVTAIYIVSTQILINLEQKQVNQGVNRCLECKQWCQSLAQKQCSICLEHMSCRVSKYVEVKVCKHLYHRRCLVQWLMRNKTCPLCRVNIYSWEEEQQREEVNS